MHLRALIGRAVVVGLALLVATLWSPWVASQVNSSAAAARSMSLAPDLGASAVGASPLSAADAEAQLREIENTKKLMKALGELHDKSGPVSSQAPSPAAQLPLGAPPVTKAPTGAPPAAEAGLGASLDLPGVPTEQLREIAGGVAQAARNLGIASTSTQSSSRDGSSVSSAYASDTSPEVARSRPRGPEDEQRFKALLDQLLDEILPWVVGFFVLFGLGYTAYSWVSNRAGRPARHRHQRGSRSSGARRHTSQASEVRSSGRDRAPERIS